MDLQCKHDSITHDHIFPDKSHRSIIQWLDQLWDLDVALWLQNDGGLYEMARMYREHGYKSLSHMLMEFSPTTPDNVKWDDDSLNIVELNEMLSELWHLVNHSVVNMTVIMGVM